MELGDPTSYLTLEEGTPVFSVEEDEVGSVTHVLAVPEDDIFDGLVIDTRLGPGGNRFVDASQVRSIHERGVVLELDAAACATLPEPSENPAAMGAQPDDTTPDDLEDKLRRAWDRISGNY